MRFTQIDPYLRRLRANNPFHGQGSLVHHPPEVLCKIFHYAIGRLPPLLHVCYQWRRSVLGDSSLWTTIYLSDIFALPLLDIILACTDDRLLTVHVHYPNINRGERLWKLLYRIEELDYLYGTRHIFPFLSSLGPAPNLKVLRLRDEDQDFEGDDRPWQQDLSKVVRGCLPLLRELHLAVSVTWLAGLFKDLRSLEFSFDADDI